MSGTEDISIKLLDILKRAEDFISGEELSELLAISRTAIWKRIDLIKKEGFEIEASTKKGYRLIESKNAYGRIAIQSGITSHIFGENLRFFHEVDSTNNVLKKLAIDSAPEGTVVVSDIQLAGRGRRGKAWMSAPNLGIWMSVLLRPNLHPSQVQTLTLAASVAVAKALEPMEIEGLGIKWPNDILINKKKVCGILTELSAETEKVEWVVIGIGLNVNHKKEDFDSEIADIATSLRLNEKNNAPLRRNEIAANIINELGAVYSEFIKKGRAWVVEEWKKYNITIGKRVNLISQAGSCEVEVLDITPEGKLIVRYDDGTTDEVFSGEISLREANLTN